MRRSELPAALAGRAFTTEEAEALGVSRKRLRAADLRAPIHGIRVPGDLDDSLRSCAAALLTLLPDAWISHGSAAKIYGLALPPRLAAEATVHLSRDTRWAASKRRGVTGHSVRAHPEEITVHHGIRIASPQRTWFDLLPYLTDQQAVIVGDQLVRVPSNRLEGRSWPWCSIADLRRSLLLNDWREGHPRGEKVLPLIRVGADSPPETVLRLSLIAAGLPEPELQIRLDPTDPFSPAGDAGYRSRRVVIQYDGRHHLTREQQTSDIRRDQQWADADWTVIRADSSDLRSGFIRVINRLRRCFGEGA